MNTGANVYVKYICSVYNITVELMKHYQGPTAEVKVNDKLEIIELIYHSYTLFGDFKNLMENFLTIAQEYPYKKWLFDQRNITVLAPTTIDWIMQDWYPRSVKLLGSERKVAVVHSEDVFAKISSESIVSQIMNSEEFSEGYLQKDFADVDTAFQWLKDLD